jgi:hypothetical protein
MSTYPLVNTNRYGDKFCSIHYTSEFYSIVPKDIRETRFDCFVVNLQQSLPSDTLSTIANQLAQPMFEWIEVFGYNAKNIHDMIDIAAVKIGRQRIVGEGNPMTTWDDDPIDIDVILTYIYTGGQGTCDWKIILVIGTEEEFRDVVQAQRAFTTRPNTD